MVQHLRDLAEADPTHPCVADEGVTFTRADVNDRVNRAISILADVGVAARGRVAMTGPLYHSSLGLIEAHRISLLGVVPTNFVRWGQLPRELRESIDVSSLQLVTHTAAKCPVAVKQAMIEWLGPILVEGYGGSELGALTAIDSATWLQHPGSVGRALPGLEVCILDDGGGPLDSGEVGRIYARGAGQDVVYLDDPDKTAAAHVGEWFTIGDLGWLDDDGYLFIADRRDDLIVAGGVNIYPAEVEAVLLEHRAVADVAVFGIPDPEWGATVKAAVELRDGFEPSAALEADLIGFTRARLAHYKCPRSVDFPAALPRLDNGKLYRRLLRGAYADATFQ
jgi:long-chain acyl-CoA synthetase